MTVADGSHRFVTARQKPPLLLVKPSVQADQLCFDAPDMERLCIPIKPDVTTLVRQQAKYADILGPITIIVSRTQDRNYTDKKKK